MAVAPDDFLSEFIDSLDREGNKVEECKQPAQADNGFASPTPEVNQTNVWIDIEEAMNRWANQILDAESRHERTASFRENIEASLQRQQLDGFHNHHDISELRYIADLWTNLLTCISSYTIGCEFVRRDIITYLLELYKLRQITDCLFIETCLRL